MDGPGWSENPTEQRPGLSHLTPGLSLEYLQLHRDDQSDGGPEAAAGRWLRHPAGTVHLGWRHLQALSATSSIGTWAEVWGVGRVSRAGRTVLGVPGPIARSFPEGVRSRKKHRTQEFHCRMSGCDRGTKAPLSCGTAGFFCWTASKSDERWSPSAILNLEGATNIAAVRTHHRPKRPKGYRKTRKRKEATYSDR